MATRETVMRTIRELQAKGKLGQAENTSGDNWTFSCPFRHNHGGRVQQGTPSFAIHTEEGLWNCFSKKCGAGGTSIHNLYARLMDVSDDQAKEVLGDEVMPLSALEANLEALRTRQDDFPTPLGDWPAETKLIHELAECATYLESRNIPRELWAQAELVGFHGERLETFDGKGVRGTRILMPIYWEGQRVGYSARGIYDWQKPKYYRPISNVGSCVYNPAKITPYEHDTIFVVEGEFDALVCMREKIPAIATFSAGVNRPQAQFLARFKQVIFLYDPDEAGFIGANKAIEKYKGFFASTRRFDLPAGMDPGDMPSGFGQRLLAMAEKKPSKGQALDSLRAKLEEIK